MLRDVRILGTYLKIIFGNLFRSIAESTHELFQNSNKKQRPF